MLLASPDIKPKEAASTLKVEYNDNFRQTFYYAKKVKKSGVKTVKDVKKVDQGHNFTPPNMTYKDDPDELLMSVAIRELNKPQPDPRWASILINCKKENITTKSEVLEEFKQLPTQVLVNLLSKSLQKES